MKKILIALSLLLLPFVATAAVLGDGNVGTLDQFNSTTTPDNAITQRIFGKLLKLSGYTSGCAQFSSTGVLSSTGIDCGTGGGSSFPFSPDTNFGVSVQSTSTPIWDTAGIQASSTSRFEDANFNGKVGIQTDSPEAPLHVNVKYGTTISPPATVTVGTPVLDSAIDSPASASATEITKPTDPSGLSVNFTYIDQPGDGGWYATQNTGETGFTANGQTITYQIYAYRNIGGVLVKNPNPFSSITFTDTINDGSTQFGVDIGNWNTPSGYQDGFYISRTDSSTGLTEYEDVGNTTAISDQGFTGTNVSVNSPFPSTGSSWNMYLAQYKTVGGVKYKTGFQNVSNTDPNLSGVYLILVDAWNPASDDGFVIGNYSDTQFQDITTATTFYDYGQSLAGDPTTYFSSVAFPQFVNSFTNGSASVADPFNYGSGGFTATGDSWSVEVWGYKTNPTNGVKYYINFPDTATFGTDDSSFSPMYFTGSFTPGDAEGYVVKILDNGSVVAAQDIGNTSSYSVVSISSNIDTSTSITAYTGITRNFSAYGNVTSPTTKYSSTHKDYSFTDTNQAGGYLILHTLATFGNATDLKVLESSYRSGATYIGTTVGSFVETNTSLGDGTVSPTSSGFTGDGSTYHYTVYSNKTVNGTNIYSTTGTSGSVTLANDGLNYTIPVSWASVSGATYKIKRIINSGSPEYRTDSGTSYSDNTTVSYGDTSTITPNQALGSDAFFDQAGSLITSPANIQLRNTAGNLFNGIDFMNSLGGGSYQQNARFGVDSSGNLYGAVGFTGSSGFVIKDSSYNDFVTLKKGSNTSGMTFNTGGTSGVDGSYLGSGGTTILQDWDTSLNTVFFGATNFPNDPASAVAITPKDTSDSALTLLQHTGSNASAPIFRIKADGNFSEFEVNSVGQASIGKALSGNGVLEVNGANNGQTQIAMSNSGSLPSTPVAGGLEYSTSLDATGKFYGTNASGVRKPFLNALANTTANQYWRSDSNGNPIADNALNTISGVILAANLLFEGKQGMSIDSSQSLTMGSNAPIILGGGSNIQGNAAGNGMGLGTTTPWATLAVNPIAGKFANQFVVGSSTKTNFIIKNDGKVGIGTTTPTFSFSVEGISSLGNQAIASFFTATSSIATSTFAGGFGQGTTTPMAFNAIYNSSSMIARVVSQLISGVQYVVEEIDRFGHLITSAPAPSLTSCGTSPTITGNDRNGTITTGSGISVTACTMTFANAYPAGSTVECTESTDSTVGFAAITSVSTSAVTFGLSASLASGHIYYICQAHQ